MERTIEIDGRNVTFKSTAGTPYRYKQQFGSDFFTDIVKMFPLQNIDMDNIDDQKVDEIVDLFERVDFDVFYGVLWAMAKTADKNIPDPLTWLDEFDEFPLMDIFPQVQDLLLHNLKSSKKK